MPGRACRPPSWPQRFLVAGIVLGFVVLGIWMDRDTLLAVYVQRRVGRSVGRRLHLDRLRTGWLGKSVELRGAVLEDTYVADVPEVRLRRLSLHWSPLCLLAGQLSLDRLRVDGGTWHLYRRRDGTYSIEQPKDARKRPAGPSRRTSRRSPRANRLSLVVKDFRVRDVDFSYDDYKRPMLAPFPPFYVEEFRAQEFRAGIHDGDPPFLFWFRGGIRGRPRARIVGDGSVSPLGDKPYLQFSFLAEDLPLPPLLRVFAQKVPFMADTGTLTIRARMRYTDSWVHHGRAQVWLREILQVSPNPSYVRRRNSRFDPDKLVQRMQHTIRFRRRVDWKLDLKFKHRLSHLKFDPSWWYKIRPIESEPTTRAATQPSVTVGPDTRAREQP